MSHWSRQQRNGPGRLLLHEAGTRSRFEEPWSSGQGSSLHVKNHNLLQQLTSPGQLLCLCAKDSIKILQSTKINSRQTAEDQSSVQVGKRMRFCRFYGLLFVRYFPQFSMRTGSQSWCPNRILLLCHCLRNSSLRAQNPSSSHDSKRVKTLKTQVFFIVP